MDLYHEVIASTMEILGRPSRSWTYEEKAAWKDLGENELILKKEAAYELGANQHSALHFLSVTTDTNLLKRDQILLFGKDLGELKEDTAYGRIAILGLRDVSQDEDLAYKEIRELEFVKYHIFPEGFMMRISSSSGREQVRIRKASLKKGMSFRNIGANFIGEYKKNPNIQWVHMLFVTQEDLVKRLEPLAEKNRQITEALNHILDGLPTDCGACSMKVLCDEVEGMREMHFKREGDEQSSKEAR